MQARITVSERLCVDPLMQGIYGVEQKALNEPHFVRARTAPLDEQASRSGLELEVQAAVR